MACAFPSSTKPRSGRSLSAGCCTSSESCPGKATRPYPRLLIVAPMSGHYATLLRGTVEALLPSRRLHGRLGGCAHVPVAAGSFDLDDYVDYVIELLQVLGPHPRHCRLPAVGAGACGGAAMEARTIPSAPVVDPDGRADRHAAQSNRSSTSWPQWLDRSNGSRAMSSCPASRFRTRAPCDAVYPGFMQLTGFMTMNLERHMNAHIELFRRSRRGQPGARWQSHRDILRGIPGRDGPSRGILSADRRPRLRQEAGHVGERRHPANPEDRDVGGRVGRGDLGGDLPGPGDPRPDAFHAEVVAVQLDRERTRTATTCAAVRTSVSSSTEAITVPLPCAVPLRTRTVGRNVRSSRGVGRSAAAAVAAARAQPDPDQARARPARTRRSLAPTPMISTRSSRLCGSPLSPDRCIGPSFGTGSLMSTSGRGPRTSPASRCRRTRTSPVAEDGPEPSVADRVELGVGPPEHQDVDRPVMAVEELGPALGPRDLAEDDLLDLAGVGAVEARRGTGRGSNRTGSRSCSR